MLAKVISVSSVAIVLAAAPLFAASAKDRAEKAASTQNRAEAIQNRVEAARSKATAARSRLTAGQVAVAAPAEKRQVAGQANFGNVVSALNNISAQIDDVEVLSDIGEIELIDIDDVRVNVVALNNALNRNETDIDILQDVLNENQDFVDALNDVNINVSDVIAVNVLSGGDVVVFTR